jgi:hypothetical protein
LILRPCGNIIVEEEEDTPSDARLDLSNRFASLEVQEPSAKWLSSQEANAQVPPSPPSSAPAKGTTYTLQNVDDDKYLAIFCLYEDLNSLREQTCQMWTKYRLGSVDLVSVSLTTNVALELGTHLEKEFLEVYPELNTGYKIMVALLRILQSQTKDSFQVSVGIGESGCIHVSRVLSE